MRRAILAALLLLLAAGSAQAGGSAVSAAISCDGTRCTLDAKNTGSLPLGVLTFNFPKGIKVSAAYDTKASPQSCASNMGGRGAFCQYGDLTRGTWLPGQSRLVRFQVNHPIAKGTEVQLFAQKTLRDTTPYSVDIGVNAAAGNGPTGGASADLEIKIQLVMSDSRLGTDFRVTVTNHGPDRADNVSADLTGDLGPRAYLQATGFCHPSGKEAFHCSVPQLSKGASRVSTVHVEPAMLHGDALDGAVFSTTDDPHPGNNRDRAFVFR